MTNLPTNPGLARRLAYGNYIRSRSFNQRQNLNILVEELSTGVEHLNQSSGLCLNKLIQNTTIAIITTSFFCPICQDIKEPSCISRHLSCGHTFHIECIEYWLKDNTNCPMCRCDLRL
jgi:hypothetical protein